MGGIRLSASGLSQAPPPGASCPFLEPSRCPAAPCFPIDSPPGLTESPLRRLSFPWPVAVSLAPGFPLTHGRFSKAHPLLSIPIPVSWPHPSPVSTFLLASTVPPAPLMCSESIPLQPSVIPNIHLSVIPKAAGRF